MKEPKFKPVDRIADTGELILCRHTLEIWKAGHVFENGNVVVAEWMPLFSDSPEFIILYSGCYYVMEQNHYNVTVVDTPE